MRTTPNPVPCPLVRQVETTTPDAHAHDALAKSALRYAKLVIERSMNESRLTLLHTAPPAATVQARWYAQVEKGLQMWLNRGGFSQADDAEIAETDMTQKSAASPDICVD